MFDPKIRSFWLQTFDGLFEGAPALVARAKETGKFDYDAPMAGLEALDRYTIRIRLVHPAYDLLFDGQVAEAYRGNPEKRRKWAAEQVTKAANNMISAAAMAISCEATALAVKAGIDARLRLGGGLLDAQLGDAGLDRLGHAAERFDFFDMCARPRREIGGQPLALRPERFCAEASPNSVVPMKPPPTYSWSCSSRATAASHSISPKVGTFKRQRCK